MQMNNQPVINACVGSIRINYGEWYTPTGKTSVDFTYCEWCFRNGCTNGVDIYKNDNDNISSCNCDCPYQSSHPCIREFICDKCQSDDGGLMTCDVTECLKCGGGTYSGAMDYCAGCSALFDICI